MTKELDLMLVDFDGCALGMKTKDGRPILKRWRIATSSKPLIDHLSGFRCSRDHTHAAIQGSETQRSGFYNSEVAHAILKGLFNSNLSSQWRNKMRKW